MPKRIVYLVTDNGIDGRERTSIVAAAWTENARDKLIEKDPAKNWRGKEERIIDEAFARKEALAKLDGLDRFLLGL